MLLMADVATLALVGGSVELLSGSVAPVLSGFTLPLLVLAFVVTYAALGLYPGVICRPAEEIRLMTIANSVTFGVVGMVLLTSGWTGAVLLPALLVGWGLVLVSTPLARSAVRFLFARKPWWGYPVVVMGAGETGAQVIEGLKRQPSLGLRPVAALDDDPSLQRTLHGVPVVGGMELAPLLAVKHRITHAIFAMPGVSRARLLRFMERYARFFKCTIIVPDLFGLSSLWVRPMDLDGILGIGVHAAHMNRGPLAFKRGFDVVAASAGLLLVLPIALVLALLIKLESPGPVFYRQYRLGKGGRCFKAFKFRSMYQDADVKLQQVLREHPELRQEYETYRKLRSDPRVTRVGRLLRKYSLDELPQLLNVLRGEMSLVGPRAYMPEELRLMMGKERTILQTLPGITGLWQVSGRNGVCFETRLDMDIHYIANWSVWTDIYLLARTVPVVFTGSGAY